MPVISFFFGIYIRMYHSDHGPAHVHVEYQGHKILIEFARQLAKSAETRNIGAHSGRRS
ncbi:MAG: DUF4160 domain-containing protein [Burkholderiales bacterium]